MCSDERGFQLEQLNGFDLADFHRRWVLARLSVLAAVSGTREFDENIAIRKIPAESWDQVLRNVFDVSRRLGLSASRYFQARFELADFPQIFNGDFSPCMVGEWKLRPNGSLVLSRRGCMGSDKLHAFYCDYWREAVDGMIMGLGETERIARHSSAGRGDSLCVDVLYCESTTIHSEFAGASEIRFAPIPAEMQADLAVIRQGFLDQGVEVDFGGVSEGTLFFRLQVQGKSACGAGGRLLQDSLERQVKKRFPDLALRDFSPLAVYGERA
jgi:hypothetical protein